MAQAPTTVLHESILRSLYWNQSVFALAVQFNPAPKVDYVADTFNPNDAISLQEVACSYIEVIEHAVSDLTKIAGQKPIVTKTKKAIAGFKIRAGQLIGCKVTLRKARMYEFLDRLVTIALPRVRDFRGIPGNRGFDGRGNYAMGLKEQIVFPEINYDKVDAVRGMDIQFVTTAKTDKEAKALLKAFQLPFQN